MTTTYRMPHGGDPCQSLGGYRCGMPDCDNRFSLRSRPDFAVCPECQEIGRRAAEADKKRRQRLARTRVRASA